MSTATTSPAPMKTVVSVTRKNYAQPGWEVWFDLGAPSDPTDLRTQRTMSFYQDGRGQAPRPAPFRVGQSVSFDED